MSDHHLIDHEFLALSHIQNTPRGKGLDRRHIITIDGKSYRPGPKEAAVLARRMTARQHAANWFWCCLELATMGLFFASGAVWMVLCYGAH